MFKIKNQIGKIMRYRRRSIRLPGYDYSQPGLYFVTICTQNQKCLFGKIKNGIVHPNRYGEIIWEQWEWLEKQYPYIELDTWILMPNHLHGIIYIKHQNLRLDCRGGSRTAPTADGLKQKTLGRLIGAFKTVSTKRINHIRKSTGSKLWQRGYYEHIIRDEQEYYAIRKYILDNPIHWDK
jgi:REP element-mobilizing transposase RayT